jgi:iron complex transport system substrate-binding protein
MESTLVGVSHSCNYPAKVTDLPVMTSTRVPYTESSDVIDSFVRDHLADNAALYDLDIEALASAAPDVIVSQALCDVCAVSTGDVVAALYALPSRPTLIDLNPYTLGDVFDDCNRVGHALGQTPRASRYVQSLISRKDTVAKRSQLIPVNERPGVAFLEWLDPPFNGGHWNPELVGLAGGNDLLGASGQPSETLSWDNVSATNADILFIACCGLSTDRALEDIEKACQRPEWQSLPAVRNGRVYVSDGDAYFSRPGPRLIDGLEMMAHAFHPDIHPPSVHGLCHQVVG